MKLVVWHNLLWSRYKAGVFTQLNVLAKSRGVDVFVHQIAETAADRAVLSPVDRNLHDYPHDLIFKGNYSAIPRGDLYRALVSRAWSSDADLTILAGFERPEFWLQALTLKLRGKKYAVFCDSTLNDNPQSWLKSAAKRLFFGLSSGVFCYGERSTEYLRYHGVPDRKILIRRQAAALPRGYSKAEVIARRPATMASPDAPRFVYVGRLSEEKSLDTLLRAFALVRQTLPGAELAIVGKGPQEAELRALAQSLGLDASVIFVGSKADDDLNLEYLRATAMVLPSRSEPWGLVVNEALSFGCPVIVSDRCGCVPELVIDGVTGYAFPWGQVDALAARMLEAPSAFSDADAVTRRCLEHMAGFTPAVAARGILDGVASITGNADPTPVRA